MRAPGLVTRRCTDPAAVETNMNNIARRIGYAAALSAALIAAPGFARPQAGNPVLGPQLAPQHAADAAATSRLIVLHYEQTAMLARSSSRSPVVAHRPDTAVPHAGVAVNPGQPAAMANPPRPGPEPD